MNSTLAPTNSNLAPNMTFSNTTMEPGTSPLPASLEQVSHNKTTLEYLEQLNVEFTVLVLPAIVYLAVLMVIGIVGNSLVLYVYTYRTRTGTITRYIQALAVFDLLSCCLAMPGEIADMSNNYTFGSHPACKVVRTVNLFCTMASGVTLVVVAIDRYKRICCPLNPQITPRGARIIVVVCTCICAMLSLPSAAIFGRRTISTSWEFVNGTDCSISDRFIHTAIPLAYNSFQMLLFVVGAFILTVLYTFIARTIFRQAHLRKVRARRSSMIRPMNGETSPLPVSDRSTHSSLDPSSPEVLGPDKTPLFICHSNKRETVSKADSRWHSSHVTNKPKDLNQQDKMTTTTDADPNHWSTLSNTTTRISDVELSSSSAVSPPETPIDQQYFDFKPLVKSQANKKPNDQRPYLGHHQIRRCPMEQVDELDSTSTSSQDEAENIEHDTRMDAVEEIDKDRTMPVLESQIPQRTDDTIQHKPTDSQTAHSGAGNSENGMILKSEELNSRSKVTTCDGNGSKLITAGETDSGFGDGESQEKLRWSMTLTSVPMNRKRVLIRSHSDVGSNHRPGKQGGTRAATSDDDGMAPKVAARGDRLVVRSRGDRRRSSFHRLRDIKKLTISDPQGTRRTTLMLFLITLIYVLSFLPHLLLMIIKATHPTSLSGEGGSMELAHNILLRSYFINSVANPIIYSFCSKDFYLRCTRPGGRINKNKL